MQTSACTGPPPTEANELGHCLKRSTFVVDSLSFNAATLVSTAHYQRPQGRHGYQGQNQQRYQKQRGAPARRGEQVSNVGSIALHTIDAVSRYNGARVRFQHTRHTQAPVADADTRDHRATHTRVLHPGTVSTNNTPTLDAAVSLHERPKPPPTYRANLCLPLRRPILPTRERLRIQRPLPVVFTHSTTVASEGGHVHPPGQLGDEAPDLDSDDVPDFGQRIGLPRVPQHVAGPPHSAADDLVGGRSVGTFRDVHGLPEAVADGGAVLPLDHVGADADADVPAVHEYGRVEARVADVDGLVRGVGGGGLHHREDPRLLDVAVHDADVLEQRLGVGEHEHLHDVGHGASVRPTQQNRVSPLPTLSST
ncbi:hypothetical protein ON010_g3986 [Phytophthora cinnamomi]|nr:hypothetical protein ON010_g3986 [Phytophthora cinnamomi]